jgi:hypothetical protein
MLAQESVNVRYRTNLFAGSDGVGLLRTRTVTHTSLYIQLFAEIVGLLHVGVKLHGLAVQYERGSVKPLTGSDDVSHGSRPLLRSRVRKRRPLEPGIEIVGECNHGTATLTARASDRKVQVAFPALDSPHTTIHVGCDFFPGIKNVNGHKKAPETALLGMMPLWGQDRTKFSSFRAGLND